MCVCVCVGGGDEKIEEKTLNNQECTEKEDVMSEKYMYLLYLQLFISYYSVFILYLLILYKLYFKQYILIY